MIIKKIPKHVQFAECSCAKTQCLSIMTKLSLLDSLLQEVCIKIICSDIVFICLLLGLIPNIGSLRIKENHLSIWNFMVIKKIPKHVHFAECWLLVPKTQFCLLWPSSPCLIHFYKRCVSIWFALIIFYLSITWTYYKGWFIKNKWKPFEQTKLYDYKENTKACTICWMWTSCPKTQCLSKLSLLDSLLQEVCIKIIGCFFFVCYLD